MHHFYMQNEPLNSRKKQKKSVHQEHSKTTITSIQRSI